MKDRTKLTLGAIVAAFTLISLATPTVVFADKEKDKADYQRAVDKKINELQVKIDETRVDYKQDGIDLDQKIRAYEDRIAELRRESGDKMKDMNSPNWDRDRKDLDDRLADVRKNFYEWRFKRSINGYDDRIEDLKYRSRNEVNLDKKRALDEKIAKLEAKNNAVKAKLVDLKVTSGDNWDAIEKQLNESLKEIDRDYNELRSSL